MPRDNFKKWEPTKQQIDEIILPAYTDLSKRYVFISSNYIAFQNT